MLVARVLRVLNGLRALLTPLLEGLIASAPRSSTEVITIVLRRVNSILITPLLRRLNVTVLTLEVGPRVRTLYRCRRARKVTSFRLRNEERIIDYASNITARLLRHLSLTSRNDLILYYSRQAGIIIRTSALSLTNSSVRLRSVVPKCESNSSANLRHLSVDRLLSFVSNWLRLVRVEEFQEPRLEVHRLRNDLSN